MILERIVSGGQTGVDIAALRAAKRLGVATGGVLPHGCHALDGKHPEYIREYGMREHTSSSYAARTYANVRDSDATLRIAVNFQSSGEVCTLKAIKKYDRLFGDVIIDRVDGVLEIVPIVEAVNVCMWLETRKIRILNVAGNSEKTAPGIGAIAERFVTEMIEILRRRA